MLGDAKSHGYQPSKAIRPSCQADFVARSVQSNGDVRFDIGDLGAPDRYAWGGYVGGCCGVTAAGFALLCRDVRHTYGVPRAFHIFVEAYPAFAK